MWNACFSASLWSYQVGYSTVQGITYSRCDSLVLYNIQYWVFCTSYNPGSNCSNQYQYSFYIDVCTDKTSELKNCFSYHTSTGTHSDRFGSPWCCGGLFCGPWMERRLPCPPYRLHLCSPSPKPTHYTKGWGRWGGDSLGPLGTWLCRRLPGLLWTLTYTLLKS